MEIEINGEFLFAQALSQNEIKKIRRLMAAREDGTFLVPESIVMLWGDTTDGGRDEVKKLWLQVGGDKEPSAHPKEWCVDPFPFSQAIACPHPSCP